MLYNDLFYLILSSFYTCAHTHRDIVCMYMCVYQASDTMWAFRDIKICEAHVSAPAVLQLNLTSALEDSDIAVGRETQGVPKTHRRLHLGDKNCRELDQWALIVMENLCSMAFKPLSNSFQNRVCPKLWYTRWSLHMCQTSRQKRYISVLFLMLFLHIMFSDLGAWGTLKTTGRGAGYRIGIPRRRERGRFHCFQGTPNSPSKARKGESV